MARRLPCALSSAAHVAVLTACTHKIQRPALPPECDWSRALPCRSLSAQLDSFVSTEAVLMGLQQAQGSNSSTSTGEPVLH
jgi:hypothetical protein